MGPNGLIRGTHSHDGRCRPRTSRERGPACRRGEGATVNLKNKIDSRQARIGVIGLGYVGLPLAVEFARAGFDVTGFDVDASKIAEINAGRSYIPDVPQEEI